MILNAKRLTKVFPGSPPQEVLRGVDLQVERGESIAIMGHSGEGKSTLLNLFGTLDIPTSGSLEICGSSVSRAQLSSLRSTQIGFIFQLYNLLDDFSALDNILMPARIARNNSGAIERRARELIDEMDLAHKADQRAQLLSGGEKQRVAIARALLMSPALILADEPTGNLDRAHSQEIQNLLLTSAQKHGAALVVVTHDSEFAQRCSRLLHLKGGYLYTAEA